MFIMIDSLFWITYVGVAETKKTDNLKVIRFAVRRGLEPLTPCVTGTYSNQLN